MHCRSPRRRAREVPSAYTIPSAEIGTTDRDGRPTAPAERLLAWRTDHSATPAWGDGDAAAAAVGAGRARRGSCAETASWRETASSPTTPSLGAPCDLRPNPRQTRSSGRPAVRCRVMWGPGFCRLVCSSPRPLRKRVWRPRLWVRVGRNRRMSANIEPYRQTFSFLAERSEK